MGLYIIQYSLARWLQYAAPGVCKVVIYTTYTLMVGKFQTPQLNSLLRHLLSQIQALCTR